MPAVGMALTRLAVQMIRVLEQRQGVLRDARSAAAVDTMRAAEVPNITCD